jgi:hypothetical protein
LGGDLRFGIEPPSYTPAVHIDRIQDSRIRGDKRDIANTQWYAESVIKL